MSLRSATRSGWAGSSEVMMATVCRPDDPIERVASSDGSPVLGVDLRIVNDGKPAPAGGEGEIEYRGPGRLLEYWQRPDLTAQALDEGWWRTGDVGRLDEAGYLRVTGRIKDIIIRGGFNISAREVEEALLAHPAVTAAAVVGLPDARLGERACAVIEGARAAGDHRQMARHRDRQSAEVPAAGKPPVRSPHQPPAAGAARPTSRDGRAGLRRCARPAEGRARYPVLVSP